MLKNNDDNSIQLNKVALLMNKLLNNTNFFKSEKIPLILFQTYFDKSKVPQMIYDNINKYASEYKHYIYDDVDSNNFLSYYFKPIVLKTFNQLKLGAHKADLLRYCLMYIYGGVYLDIKIELIKPLSEIIKNDNFIYSVLSNSKDHIFQAIIISKPNNLFFLKLINYITNIQNPNDYFAFCKDYFNNIIEDSMESVKIGLNVGYEQLHYLFEERCSKDSSKCHDGLDKYGQCCLVYEDNIPIIKCRYASFPW